MLMGSGSAWMSTREAATVLGMTLRTLYRVVDEGRLPMYQFGRAYRLKRDDVERFKLGGDETGVREPRRPGSPFGSGTEALELPR